MMDVGHKAPVCNFQQQEYDYSPQDGEVLSFDHWNDAQSDNIDRVLEENRRLKPARLELFRTVVDLLEKIQVPYFVSDGTALAVYRDNGVMIPHDYDTDIGVMEEYFMTINKNLKLLPDCVRVRNFCNHTGNKWIRGGREIPFTGYGVKSFAFEDEQDFSHLKLECNYKFKVSLDIITWKESDEDPNVLTVNYASPLLDWSQILFPKSVIFPTKECVFEGVTVQGPRDLKRYLEINYGYLGKDARWDKDSKRYVPRYAPVQKENNEEFNAAVADLLLITDSD